MIYLLNIPLFTIRHVVLKSLFIHLATKSGILWKQIESFTKKSVGKTALCCFCTAVTAEDLFTSTLSGARCRKLWRLKSIDELFIVWDSIILYIYVKFELKVFIYECYFCERARKASTRKKCLVYCENKR